MNNEQPHIITYDILSGTRHGFTTRKGGVSEGCCATLNMSFSREKNYDNVYANYRRTAAAAGVDFYKMTRVPQKHTNHVLNVTEELTGMGICRQVPCDIADYGYDAMITNVPGITLCTIHADCVPVLLYDSASGSVGAVHSGWRGTALKVSKAAITMMHDRFGAKPEHIKAVIGPSICAEHFETDSDVYDALKSSFGDIVNDEALIYRTGNKYHISIAGFVYQTLIESGLAPENIYSDESCTYSNEELFFSHRRENGKTGAMAAFISLE